MVTDDVSVSRGMWCLRQNESVDDLAHSDCLKQVRHGSESRDEKRGFLIVNF